MGGHHPFSELTKDFTAEDRRIIAEMKRVLLSIQRCLRARRCLRGRPGPW